MRSCGESGDWSRGRGQTSRRLFRAARKQPAHRGGLLSRLLEGFPGQVQGRPGGVCRGGRVHPGDGDGGLRTNGARNVFADASTVGEGGSRGGIQSVCTSGTDSLELLIGELGNGSSTKLGGDKEQLDQVTDVLLLDAAPS
jgi:hypothetical protein